MHKHKYNVEEYSKLLREFEDLINSDPDFNYGYGELEDWIREVVLDQPVDLNEVLRYFNLALRDGLIKFEADADGCLTVYYKENLGYTAEDGMKWKLLCVQDLKQFKDEMELVNRITLMLAEKLRSVSQDFNGEQKRKAKSIKREEYDIISNFILWFTHKNEDIMYDALATYMDEASNAAMAEEV